MDTEVVEKLVVLDVDQQDGVLHSFNSNEDDWKTYFKRSKLYFTANNIIHDSKKWVIMLLCCWPKIALNDPSMSHWMNLRN